MLTVIVARARGGAIGRGNAIPWHLPADLKMFQRETMGGALVMGRRTWESLPVRPLKGRMNCVVSRDATLADHVFADAGAAVAAARAAGYTRVYGIGGAAIYRALLPMADRLMLTEVDLDVPDADTFFPPVDEAAWHELSASCVHDEAPNAVLRELLRKTPAPSATG